jgi:hypothetical protein
MDTNTPLDASSWSPDSPRFTASTAGIVLVAAAVALVTPRGNKRALKVPALTYAMPVLPTFLSGPFLRQIPGVLHALFVEAARSSRTPAVSYAWESGRDGAGRYFVGIPRAKARRVRGLTTVFCLSLLVLSGGLTGCVDRTELITLREGMDRGTRTIRKQHVAWAQKLSEGKASQLPTLSPADYRAVLAAHEEYRNLVELSRSQDGGSQDARSPATRP